MEGEDRRDRLAQLNLERMQRPPAEGWHAVAERARDSWNRFFAFAGWEKTAYIGAAVVALVVVLSIASILFTRSGGAGERPPSASLPDTRTSPTATALRPTPTVVLVAAPEFPTPAPTAEQNRADCNAIRGTDYLSVSERAWFLEHCNTPTAPTEPGAPRRTQPAPPTEVGVPTATPVPSGLTSSEAVSLAADWIPQHTQYAVSTSTCTPVHSGSHWVVTCQGTPAGCGSAGCQVSVSVCVFADPPSVVSSGQC